MTYNFHMPKLLFLRTCCWTCRRLHFQNKLVDKAAWINKAIVSRSKKNILVTIVSSQPNSTNDDNVEHNDCSSSEEETMDTRSELHPSWNIYEEPVSS